MWSENFAQWNFCVDAFFILKFSTFGLNNWCDVELEIYNSLKKQKDSFFGLSFWNLVYKLITEEIRVNDKISDDTLACAAYMLKKYGRDQDKTFFMNLLKELNIFEHQFGIYVDNQRSEHYKEYLKKALNFIKDFPLNLNAINSIDSFNYTNLDGIHFPVPFRNINGDVNDPIFGIDSSGITVDDPTYIFTKTSRRLIQSMTKSNLEKLDFFENVVIYGHSLNSQDYNFFFPIFDYLELDNASRTTNVIFAFSDYSGTTSEEIQKEQMKSISKILTSYENYIHPNKTERRLLDSLSAQGRIITHKV